MNRLLSGNRARVLLVSVLSAVLGITGLGAMPTAAAAPQGAIEGTVTDADGAGIKGIEVTAYEFDGVDTWTFVASSTTKNDGSYALRKLPAATYQVEFFDNDGTYVAEFYDDQPTIDLADDVPVAQGQTVAGIDAELTRTGAIRGTVTDEQGQPLPGIFIDFYTFDEDGFPTGSPNGGTTNDAGHSVAPFIAPGDVRRSGSPTSTAPTSGSTTTTTWTSSTATSSPSPRRWHRRDRRRAGARRPHLGHGHRLRWGAHRGRGDRPGPARGRRVVQLRRRVRLPAPKTTAPTTSAGCRPAPGRSASSTTRATT